MHETMSSRERITTILRHGIPDRIGIVDMFWPSTVIRWRQEGLPAGVSPEDHFGLEIRRIDWDRSLMLPAEMLEETPDYRITRNGNGMVAKNWVDTSSTPELIEFLLTGRDDWDRYKDRLAPSDDRVDWAAVDRDYRRWRSEGHFIAFSAMPGYEDIWRLVGPENALMAMASDPDWVREMSDATASLTIAMARRVLDRGIELDGAWIWDDLGYRNGLLYGRRSYRDLIMPGHRAVCDFFHSRGLPVILHSCGQVTAALDLLVEAGFDCLQPLEVKAGMDVRAVKRDWGDRLTLMGNIDVRLMSGDAAVLAAEITDKLAIAKVGGGYIYHSDHSVPHTVSYEEYRRTLALVHANAWY